MRMMKAVKATKRMRTMTKMKTTKVATGKGATGRRWTADPPATSCGTLYSGSTSSPRHQEGGDLSCVEWDPDVVRPVYRKHGWPGSDFDGDAFRVDLARANAYSKAQGHIAHFGHEVEWKKAWLIENEPNGSNYIRMKEAEEEANTVEELWVARWHLWNLGLKVRRDSEEIRRLEKEVTMRRDEDSSWERWKF